MEYRSSLREYTSGGTPIQEELSRDHAQGGITVMKNQ